MMIDKRLKEINFRNKKFFYKVRCSVSEYGDDYYTDIYLTNDKTKKRPKYYLFGPLVEVPNNKVHTTIGYDIEDCTIPKSKVQKTFDRIIELLNRCEEIKNGQIV